MLFLIPRFGNKAFVLVVATGSDPKQVSKTPESGEHVPKGAFIIRGERHYLESAALLAVGIHDEKIVGGPVSAIKILLITLS